MISLNQIHVCKQTHLIQYGYINRKRILVFIIKFKGIYILRFSWLDFQRGNFLVLTLQYVFEVFICVNILKISLL